MKEITKIVKDYLEMPNTDFALMIKGDWGSGKTYFIKNSLFSYIKGIDSLIIDKNGRKLKYKSFYISLFGVTSSDDMNEKIQLELNSWMKSKFWIVTKTGINKIASFFNVGFSKKEKQEFISIFNIKQNNVLFFDDLERIGYKKNLQNILGQINQLTEHQKLKVIIVCNSDKTDELFAKTNEKTIRFSTLYVPELTSIYDEIIKNYEEKYQQFLKEKKDFILEVLKEINYKNLRTLRFILDIFQKVFYFKIPEKYNNEILERFLLFLTIYSIESKNGNPPVYLNKLKDFGPWTISFEDILLPVGVEPKKEEKEEEKSEENKYYDKIKEKYDHFKDFFHYSEQLADYVNSGYLDQDKFNQEINEIVEELVKNEDTEETETINAIGNWRNIDDDQFNNLILSTLTKVESGELSLYAYLKIFAEILIIETFEIEHFKVNENVIKKFKTGIDKSKNKHNYDNAFNQKLSIWYEKDSPSHKIFNEIKEYLISANEQCIEKKYAKLKDEFFEKLKEKKFKEAQDLFILPEYAYTPIMCLFDSKNLFDFLKKQDNDVIRTVVYAIYMRHNDTDFITTEVREKEKEKLMQLKQLVDKYMNEIIARKVSSVPFIEFQKYLNRLLNNQETN